MHNLDHLHDCFHVRICFCEGNTKVVLRYTCYFKLISSDHTDTKLNANTEQIAPETCFAISTVAVIYLL